MKLGEMLRTVGGKLGLVRVVDMNEGAEAEPRPR